MLNAVSPITNAIYYPVPTLDTRVRQNWCVNINAVDDFVRSISTTTYQNPAAGNLRKISTIASNVHPAASEVTPQQIKTMAAKIRGMAVSFREQFQAFVDNISNITGAKSTARIKGDYGIASLENKISREMQRPHQGALVEAINKGDADKAMERIFDLFGTRFLAKDQTEIDKVYKAVYSAIENGELRPEMIANYAGRGIKPYFTKKQLLELAALGEKMGYMNVEYTKTPSRIDITKDGYTSAHVSGKINVIKNGLKKPVPLPTEIQIRTENIQEISEAIHIPYDIWNGKNILQDKSQIEQELLSPIVQAFQDIKAKNLIDKFYKYQTDCIRITKEGGKTLPKPQEYGLPESVSIEKIIELKKKL